MSKTIATHLSALLVLIAGTLSAAGASPDPAPTGIAWLDWATEQVAFALREAVPADTPQEMADSPSPEDPLAATHSIESIEIYRLQQEIRALRQLIEEQFINRIIALESELQEVKRAVQDPQAALTSGPKIPRPDALPAPDYAALDPETPAIPEMAAPLPGTPSEEPLPPPEVFSFDIVDEWGRSPEVVAELGGDAQTLIGIAGVVPPGSRREDVVTLIRDMRVQYDSYDNINIEIFDTEAAARAYAERQFADTGHHIASISRHKASGRDVMLYVGGGTPEPVPFAE